MLTRAVLIVPCVHRAPGRSDGNNSYVGYVLSNSMCILLLFVGIALTSVQLPSGADEDDDFVPFGSRHNATFNSMLVSSLWWSEKVGIVGIVLLVLAILIPIANYARYWNFRQLIKNSAKVCAWDSKLEKMVGERLAFVENDIGEGISVYDTEQAQKEKDGTSGAAGSQKDKSRDKKKETKDKSATSFQMWDIRTTRELDWQRKHDPSTCPKCKSLRENRVTEDGGEPSWELKWSGIGKKIPVVLMNASGATVASAASPATEPTATPLLVTSDAKVGDYAITVADTFGVNVGAKFTIGTESQTVSSIDGNVLTFGSGLGHEHDVGSVLRFEPPLDSNQCPGIPELADSSYSHQAFAPILPIAVFTVRGCDNDDRDPMDSVVLVNSNKNDEILKDIGKVLNKGYIPSAFLLISKKTGAALKQLKEELRAIKSVPVFLVTFDPGIIIFKAAVEGNGGRMRYRERTIHNSRCT